MADPAVLRLAHEALTARPSALRSEEALLRSLEAKAGGGGRAKGEGFAARRRRLRQAQRPGRRWRLTSHVEADAAVRARGALAPAAPPARPGALADARLAGQPSGDGEGDGWIDRTEDAAEWEVRYQSHVVEPLRRRRLQRSRRVHEAVQRQHPGVLECSLADNVKALKLQTDARDESRVAGGREYSVFVHNCGDDGLMSAEAFRDAVREILPQLTPLHATRAFFAFDRQGRGRITLREFERGLATIADGKDAQKLRFVFDMFDVRKTGAISFARVCEHLQREMSDLWEQAIFTKQVMLSLDENGDGVIERSEFVAACGANALLFECFTDGFPIYLTTSSSFELVDPLLPSHAVRERSPSWQLLRSLWFQMRAAASAVTDSVDLAGFKKVMGALFDTRDHLDHYLLGRIFDVFDADGDKSVTLVEFIQGLSMALQADLEHRARFYFRLFDNGDDGLISREHLTRVLLQRAERNGAHWGASLRRDVEALMGAMAGISALYINLEQFLHVVLAEPRFVDVVERCVFGSKGMAERLRELARPAAVEQSSLAGDALDCSAASTRFSRSPRAALQSVAKVSGLALKMGLLASAGGSAGGSAPGAAVQRRRSSALATALAGPPPIMSPKVSPPRQRGRRLAVRV